MSEHYKFRPQKSATEAGYIPYAPMVHLQKEVMNDIGSEEFRTLKRIAVNELGCNLIIDDEMFCAVLDRLTYLEKEIKRVKENT